MALRKNIDFTPNGFDSAATLTGAYFRIDNVSGNKEMLSVTVVAYNDKDGKKLPAQVKSHNFKPSVGTGAKDFIAQAYEHIKALPEYAGAEDC